jgi:ABC-type nitrate/sulfonate/bicarbonate transport system permease component
MAHVAPETGRVGIRNQDRGRPARRLAEQLRAYGTYVFSFLTLFVVWHLLATYIFPSVLFAAPLNVVGKLLELAWTGVLFEHIGISLQRILLGFGLGSVIGIPIGLLMGNIRFVQRFMEPYIEFFRFIPAIALLTVAVIWFGIGETSKVFLIIYTTIFIVILNTTAGVLSIPANKIRAAQCLGASPTQIFLHVSIPATLPFVLTGMRIAMGNSFATIVSAEMLGANAGVGTMMWTARLYMLVDELFVGLLTLGLLGFAADRAFRFLIFRFAGKYSPVV